MIKIVTTTLLIMLTSLILSAQDLKKYRWDNRIIIVKSISLTHHKFQKQLKEFQGNEDGLAERKIVLFEIVGGKYRITDYTSDCHLSEWKTLSNPQLKLTSKSDFEVVLIGLDNGVKLMQNDLFTYEDLCRKIDSMPMRMAEIRGAE
ncbi:DUF4174 domain-containing protein [Flammeovirga agarivorans]|uniref:DUF4174 domain-containing protein n=1 Tax=Flammeovirga agarivorans TaxID=2726742 RepID=A0A7X8XYQ1_9BACT|nr:DUF4174 domain-containing protein [Flammeovirga agarivorans]NLR94338.1 DUF4174 domain-containing protein [Flammeovirga agarivorans]